ncbi:MAG: hypothetical protein KA482_00375, partial [Sphingobium sp.]|nr:hypothetical protein [Sphingobium sp.]
MAEHLYVVSSEWGGAKGGLNVFNKALVEGLARVTGAGVKIIAVVAAAQSIPTSPGAAFSFLPYDGTGKGLADKIKQDTEETPHAITKIVIIGHDVHTGHHALEARNVLRAEQHNCVAGVFCHMDYSAYQKFKFQPIERISQKVEMQRDIIRNADHVYAVGPLLSQAFTDLRGASGAKTPVQQIIPGVPDTLSQLADANPAKALHFFFSGRIDPENDPIKNGRLALQAICDAYEKNRRSNETRWQQRGQFTAFGLAD